MPTQSSVFITSRPLPMQERVEFCDLSLNLRVTMKTTIYWSLQHVRLAAHEIRFRAACWWLSQQVEFLDWPRMGGIPYVFPGQNGGGHLQNIRRAWDRIRLKAGIQDVRFHDLRRTVGSWLAGSGESLHLIGMVLNHSDVSTTAIYARLSLDPVRQALERNAAQMLEAVELQRVPAVMRMAKKRPRSTRNPTSHRLELAGNEQDPNILPVAASR
jgi:hypothetical protein